MTTKEVMSFLDESWISEKTSMICSLGRTAQEVYDVSPNQTLFLDAMGDVVSTAIGVALGVAEDPVIAFDTDGSNLMGITILSSLAALKNKLQNLAIIVFNNNILESGGGMKTTDVGPNWEHLGEAWGIQTVQVTNLKDLKNSFEKFAFKELTYFVVNVDNTECVQGDSTKDIDGIESKYIFTRHLERVKNEKILKPCLKN